MTYKWILLPPFLWTFASPMLRLLFDHILRHVPKQWRCCTPYVTHCLPNGFVWRQFQLDHCSWNAQNDSQYGGCARTVKQAGRPLIGIRHFSSNRENPEKQYWRLAAAPRILSRPTVLRKTNVLTKPASCCLFNIWTTQPSLKKMVQNKPWTWHCRPTSYCV